MPHFIPNRLELFLAKIPNELVFHNFFCGGMGSRARRNREIESKKASRYPGNDNNSRHDDKNVARKRSLTPCRKFSTPKSITTTSTSTGASAPHSAAALFFIFFLPRAVKVKIIKKYAFIFWGARLMFVCRSKGAFVSPSSCR